MSDAWDFQSSLSKCWPARTHAVPLREPSEPGAGPRQNLLASCSPSPACTEPGSEVSCQLTGSCLSQALSIAVPASPSLPRAVPGLWEVCAPSCQGHADPLSRSWWGAELSSAAAAALHMQLSLLAGSLAVQGTRVSPGENGAGVNHVDLDFPGGSSAPFVGPRSPYRLSMVKAGEAAPRPSWLQVACIFSHA